MWLLPPVRVLNLCVIPFLRRVFFFFFRYKPSIYMREYVKVGFCSDISTILLLNFE